MNTLLITFHVIICLVIIFIVLLQVGRGAEAGAMFGGSGQSQTMRGGSTFMGKFTTAMAVAFMLTSFLLTYDTSKKAKSSVTESIRVEQTETIPAPLQTGQTAEDGVEQKAVTETPAKSDTAE